MISDNIGKVILNLTISRFGNYHIKGLDMTANKQVTIAIVGAGNRGLEAYGGFIKDNPQLAKVTAVAEPYEPRRTIAADLHNIPNENIFSNWQDLAARDKLADAVIISTPDIEHKAAAVAFAEKGYHILLEKPMATTLEDCQAIVDSVEKNNVSLAVCHVLRYSPYFVKVKDIINSGQLGDIISLQHTEGVGWMHYAHSYVRGNWRNTETSTFMLMAKSCHDIDLINWWIDKKCTKVSSFGSLNYFKLANKPSNAADNCLDCPLQDQGCTYSAKKYYFDFLDKGSYQWPLSVLLTEFTPEALEDKLRNSTYGNCVYTSDNDVVDHQVVAMEYEDGITATFTMTAFAPGGRKTILHGTNGYMEGDGKSIRILDYSTDTWTEISADQISQGQDSGHHGGDSGIMNAFLQSLSCNDPDMIRTGSRETLHSHIVVFAAEQSRLEGRTIEL